MKIHSTLFGLLVLIGCSAKNPGDRTAKEAATNPKASELTAETVAKIERFCGDCHPFPIPSTFPKADWPGEVKQGYDFYIESNRHDLEEPIRQDVVRYYQNLAPEKVLVERADSMPAAHSPVKFARSAGMGIGERGIATSHLVWQPDQKGLLFVDMLEGGVSFWKRDAGAPDFGGNEKLLLRGKNSCRVHVCDWNGDGLTDYLLGELGSFPVGDHQNGKVTLHLGRPDGSIESRELARGLGRVVQAVPFDFDEDGDTDVLVGDFGWRKTGALRLLRNRGTTASPQMEMEVLDPRHGALGVEVADLDGDGKRDFVVAYGQEYETVEAFMNRGSGEFTRNVLLKLPDPSYNSSSFQIVDLDRDGRLDIVHTAGDTMDALLPKPYHGLRWVRNLGDRWENRELGLLIGALQSTVADFDGDGDLDIAAIGLFPKAYVDGPGAYDSICWWEQKDGLEFVRHSVERDHCMHASCTSADVDEDGRVDLIVGEWLNETERSAFRVFFNRPNAKVE